MMKTKKTKARPDTPLIAFWGIFIVGDIGDSLELYSDGHKDKGGAMKRLKNANPGNRSGTARQSYRLRPGNQRPQYGYGPHTTGMRARS